MAFMKKQMLLPILFLFAGIGCANDDSSHSVQEPIQNAEAVQDEASSNERQMLEETMQLIQGYATEWGVTMDLNRIPIVVTSKRLDLNASSQCVYRGNVGIKMLVQKQFFTERVYEKDTGYASPLFNLLVHEIGHCYMMRKHEDALLRKTGYKAQFVIESNKGNEKAQYYSVQASMMHNQYFRMPRLLERYYVGEIFGKFRAKSLDDLQKYYSFELVQDRR